MTPVVPSWSRDGARLLRWLAVVLALACQIGAGGSIPGAGRAEDQAAALSAASIFCQSDSHKAAKDQPSPHRHGPDQGIAVLADAGSTLAALVRSGPAVPVPAAMRIGGTVLPGARAPPLRFITATSPRGPPQTV